MVFDRRRTGSLRSVKNGPDNFDLREIDRANGAPVIVRPDQFVANVLPLKAHDELSGLFQAFLLHRR